MALSDRGMGAFSGTENAGSFDLIFELDGIDLSPCPVLEAAGTGLSQAFGSGNLTQGVGQIPLGPPSRRVLHPPHPWAGSWPPGPAGFSPPPKSGLTRFALPSVAAVGMSALASIRACRARVAKNEL